MPTWQKIIVSGSNAELNSLGLVTSMSVGANQVIATTQAGTKLSGSFTGSFKGDGSQLTGVSATNVEYANILNKPTLVSASSQIDHDLTDNYVANEHIDHSTVSISAGIGLTGGGDITSTRTLSLDTGSATFLDGVKNKLNTEGVFSSSAQLPSGTVSSSAQVSYTGLSNIPAGIVSSSGQVTALLPTGTVSASSQVVASQVTGIGAYATTASNVFTGTQTINDTTNSTTFSDGAVVIAGGLGVGKNVNISGSLTVTGLLTAVSMSTQYVTSSQYTIGTSRVIVNDDDLVRFAGISVIDSGSTFGTGSLLWDSLNNRWIYEADDQSYNSAVLIAGPKNTGTLGNEVGLTDHRVPVAHGDDHIDSRPESSSIRIDFPSRLTHIEAGLQVTGSISSSVGFSGNGAGLTNVTAANVEYANILNKPTLVSASGQIDHDLTDNFVANEHIDHSTVSITAGSGLTGGGDITSTRTLSLDTGSTHFTDGVKTKLNTENVVSSSAQIKTVLNTETVVSSSTQIKAVLNTENVHSGSYLGTATTSNLPEGTNLYYLDTRVKDKLNAESVVSSSTQTIAHIAGQTIAPATINATTINASGNVVVTGDLTVNGTTTTLNTTNVLIEDRYLLLNSGSVAGAPAQGGIVVQDGVNASGSALLYSTANSKNRWGVAEGIAANATDATQTAYVATVTDMNVAAHSAAVATYEKPGNIKIETNGDIYIWA